MAINARFLVDVVSRTITGGSPDLVTNGMVLTRSLLIPTDRPAMEFSSASAVANFFGDDSEEASFAQQYFMGLTNQQKAPETLVIGSLLVEPTYAWVRMPVNAELEELKALTKDKARKITLMIDGVKTVGDVSFAEADSMSAVAESIVSSLNEGSLSSRKMKLNADYIEGLKSVVLTLKPTESQEANKTLPSVTLPNLKDVEDAEFQQALCLTIEAGAVVSSPSKGMTLAKNLDAITSTTANWTQFTTLHSLEEMYKDKALDAAKELSAWADIYDDAVFVFWSNDKRMVDPLTQKGSIAANLHGLYNCTICVYSESAKTAATVLAYPATIKWDAVQGVKVLFGKAASGVPAIVTTEEEARALDKIGVTYIGQFATRNAEFTFANSGALTSSMYGYYDVLIGQIWFKAKCQRACMDGFASVNRVPYNAKGFSMIEAWLADPIEAAKKVGVIDTGLRLSNAQKAQILQETGSSTVLSDLENNGYWLQVEAPEANVRAKRGSPTMNLLVTYAGSVQKIELPITCVL